MAGSRCQAPPLTLNACNDAFGAAFFGSEAQRPTKVNRA